MNLSMQSVKFTALFLASPGLLLGLVGYQSYNHHHDSSYHDNMMLASYESHVELYR